jgi:hypothetical protein
VTVGAAGAGLFADAFVDANPVEGGGEAAIAAEGAPVRAVTVTVMVTVAGAPVVPALTAADVTDPCGVCTVAVAVAVAVNVGTGEVTDGENTVGGNAPGEVAR